MGGSSPLLQGECHPQHGIPLFLHNVQVSGFGQQRREDSSIAGPVDPIELLILEIPNARHEVVAQQIPQRQDDLGIAVRVKFH
jgi:hypothetical protein